MITVSFKVKHLKRKGKYTRKGRGDRTKKDYDSNTRSCTANGYRYVYWFERMNVWKLPI